jgi:hypothetical protein
MTAQKNMARSQRSHKGNAKHILNVLAGPLVVHQGRPNENNITNTGDATAQSEAVMGAYLWLIERSRQHLQTYMHDSHFLAANLPLAERLYNRINVYYIHATE